MRKGWGLAVAAALSLASWSSKGFAADQPGVHPDLSGLWIARNHERVFGRAFDTGPSSKTASGGESTSSRSRDGNFVNGEIDSEFITKASQDMPLYRPEFWDQVHNNEEFGYRRPADPGYGCKNPGIVRLAAPAEIFMSPGKATFIYGGPIGDATIAHIWVREIPLDGRPLPKPDDYEGLRPTGSSVGHWEGDTLVIETVDFPADGVWYATRGWVGSAEAKITERFTRKGDILSYDQTIEDPAFLKPWVKQTLVLDFNRNPKSLLPQPLTCNERDAAELPPSSK